MRRMGLFSFPARSIRPHWRESFASGPGEETQPIEQNKNIRSVDLLHKLSHTHCQSWSLIDLSRCLTSSRPRLWKVQPPPPTRSQRMFSTQSASRNVAFARLLEADQSGL